MELLQQGLGETRQALDRMIEEGHTGVLSAVAAGREDLQEYVVGEREANVTTTATITARVLSTLYLSTSRTVGAPNHRLTRPRSHNPQAVTVEYQPTRQAQ